MDRWTDAGCIDKLTHRKIMLLSHTLTMKGSDVASFVEFRPSFVEFHSVV